ncbi:hypothetical protein E1200_11605 [Actinomadura sp. GC306]|uniref:hypothetical protein n=1 Tax=Actinomadura sp. GC306 TaxID=2530367 RepID=UPI00104D8CBB|nr:hypothetical protein [Actinomadura sp. GC306]TDC68426.1 hypothetical protein E1200_11605 [Actinomadura sp. GC306]
MSRTIRIDDEVAAFLERSKREGETVDQFLRRWLGLAPAPDRTGRGGTGSTLTVPERAVLDVLTSTGAAMTAAQITVAASISPAATGKALRWLEQAGKIQRHHVPNKVTRRWHSQWRITTNRAPGET